MIDDISLLDDLIRLLTKLEDDLRARCESQPEVDAPLRAQYDAAREANRTAQAYEVWRDDQITQAAVAWILGCVFVRFCEDNHLVDPPRLSGPGDRRQRAEDEHTLYFQRHPAHSDREYLLWVFDEVAKLPAMKELFDHRHNPLWSIQVSGDGAMALREFFLRRDPATGLLIHDFSDPAFGDEARTSNPDFGSAGGDPTRFLGDLYQDLSESARKKYALLQTPIFVEEFILDRTLEPAIREFGFQQVRMIDPTCGSGHFLLGGFRRLFDLWVKHEPATNVRELTQRSLNGLCGVDLNPYAVAIARFRLLVAALRACGITRLVDAPAFTIHLAAGDSLLHGPRPSVTGDRQHYLLGADPLGHVYNTEDAPLLRQYLGQQYHAVVGNPPYITVKDKATNQAYRDRFGSCHRKYSLAMPFFERFFDLALKNNGTGYVGMITTNSFMKREFGRKLIEDYIPRWDLSHVVDCGGAYIPGHGTPTVIVFGRNRAPVQSTVRVAMGIRGEPRTPDDPSRGEVWSAIMRQLDEVGSCSEYLSVADVERQTLHNHPWSIGGGGVAELKELLDERGCGELRSLVLSSGFGAILGEDEAFSLPIRSPKLRKLPHHFRRRVLEGELVRDWSFRAEEEALFPYDARIRLVDDSLIRRWLWEVRTLLWSRGDFNKVSYRDAGRTFWEYHQIPEERNRTSLSIVFAAVSSHNHLVLAREPMIFKQSVPIINLKEGTSLDDHFQILGLLNSSVACFWMKQVFYPEASSSGDISLEKGKPEANRYDFASTGLMPFPLHDRSGPSSKWIALAAEAADREAAEMREHEGEVVLRGWAERGCSTDLGQDLRKASEIYYAAKRRLVVVQEELDWECYRAFGLSSIGADPTVLSDRSVGTEANSRPFLWADKSDFARLPQALGTLYLRRWEEVSANPDLRLIETKVFKRLWLGRQGVYGHAAETYEGRVGGSLRAWLVDGLAAVHANERAERSESKMPAVWSEGEPRLMSVAQLADRVRQDEDFLQVAALYRGRDDFDLTRLVAELVEDEAVPILPVLRYKESGLRNRRVWEQVWDLQRQEDAIDARTKLPPADPQHLTEPQAKAEKKAKIGDIPVPPKYKSPDMASGTIWRLRGKLDVPKERFVSFPYCQRDADPTMVITWAGYDHLQQMQAVAAYYMDVKEREGWPADRRVALLAGMLELLPWVSQWHNAPEPANDNLYMGNYYRDFINEEAREVGKTADEIRAWTPPAKQRSRSSRRTRVQPELAD